MAALLALTGGISALRWAPIDVWFPRVLVPAGSPTYSVAAVPVSQSRRRWVQTVQSGARGPTDPRPFRHLFGTEYFSLLLAQ